MSASGWTISDSAQGPQQGGGWSVSDSATPPAASAPDLTANPKGEGIYQMQGPAGKTVGIPYSNVPVAAKQGYSFADAPNRWRYNRDYSYATTGPGHEADYAASDRNAPKPLQVVSGIVKGIGSMAKPALDVVGAAAGVPQESIDQSLQGQTPLETAGKVGMIGAAAAPAAIAAPLATAGGVAGGTAAGTVEGKLTRAAGWSPRAQALATDAAAMLGGFAGGAGAEPLAQAAKSEAAASNIPLVSRFARERSEVPSENFTPRQAKSHAAVIAEGAPGGDTGYIPRDIAQATGSKLRETAAANPAEVRAIRQGTPEDAYAAHQSILEKAKSEIDQRHEAALGTAQDAPVDMKPVQQAIQPTKYQLEGMDDADARAIQDLQQRAAQVQTLRGLNEFRKTLNNEDAALLKNPMGSGKSALYPQMVHRMANAVRDAYYDALEKATGQDFSADKRLEGNIIQEMRGALGSAPRLAINEAREAAPQSAGQIGADILEGGAHDTRPGVPIISAFADRLRGTRLGQIQQHLQRFYSDLPAPPVPEAKAPAGPPANRLLPGGPPQVPTTSVPNPSPEPSVVTPAPDQAPQLPAQAGPAGTGVPEVEPRTAPPNAAGVTERTRPPLAPNPQPTPPGRTVVTPEGTAIPERKALPAPVKAPKSGKTVGIGDTVSVNGRTGRVTGVNAKTGRIQVEWH